MKATVKVKDKTNGKIGISHGPVFKYGIWWILVEYESGSKAIILEQHLETLDES